MPKPAPDTTVASATTATIAAPQESTPSRKRNEDCNRSGAVPDVCVHLAGSSSSPCKAPVLNGADDDVWNCTKRAWRVPQ
eukprot:NODE_23750_length_652_cov_7.487619.p3 GENE.NODE_23750_length_652_cov_7.487619~~NODE_23750_length_652_cov_7.487619.p3  ORF type:complete len:80 (-),score=2.00 NODE_23750_length_652_cov_7.487619:51-290(-)